MNNDHSILSRFHIKSDNTRQKYLKIRDFRSKKTKIEISRERIVQI